MARKKMSTEGKVALGVAGVAGSLLLYYALAGAGSEKNAALIPDSIEARLDKVVDELNLRYGKSWVNFGLGVLQAGLSRFLPSPLVALVSAVYKAEQMYWGQQGDYKRWHAAQYARGMARA